MVVSFFGKSEILAIFHETLMALSEKAGVSVQSVQTSLPDNSQRGIASETDFSLKVPKVAILADKPAEQTSYGLILFVLEQKCGLEVSSSFVRKTHSRCPRPN